MGIKFDSKVKFEIYFFFLRYFNCENWNYSYVFFILNIIIAIREKYDKDFSNKDSRSIYRWCAGFSNFFDPCHFEEMSIESIFIYRKNSSICYRSKVLRVGH